MIIIQAFEWAWANLICLLSLQRDSRQSVVPGQFWTGDWERIALSSVELCFEYAYDDVKCVHVEIIDDK